jgi:hypothetical protein
VNNDIFNSAPLVILYSGGIASSYRVFVSSAAGNLYAFGAGSSVSNGPSFISQDLPAIPPENLPQSTFCFLSVTPAGTILATTSMGGSTWNDQKAFVAIVNGVAAPPRPPAASSGLSAGAKAGIVFGVLSLLAIVGVVAFIKIPAFAEAVTNAASAAKELFERVTGSSSSTFKPRYDKVQTAAAGATTYGAV